VFILEIMILKRLQYMDHVNLIARVTVSLIPQVLLKHSVAVYMTHDKYDR